MAVRRLLRALVLVMCWYHLFSLPAGEPKGRVFRCSVTAFNASLFPSGVVPGDGAGGRDVELVFVAGGEGSNGILLVLPRVLFIKVEECMRATAQRRAIVLFSSLAARA
jgi:hypothetical protein